MVKKDVFDIDKEHLMKIYNDESIVDILMATRSLYYEVVSDYASLNKELGLTNPIEVHFLFSSMLHGGYLSKDGVFYPTSNGTIDYFSIPKLNGASILAGIGICRHATSFFSSVLDEMEIENKPLVTYWYNNKQKLQTLRKTCRYLEMIGLLGLKETLKLPYVYAIANHGINKATYEDTNYYLDTYNNRIYLPSSDENFRLQSDNNFILVRESDYEGKKFADEDMKDEKRKKVFEVINDRHDLLKSFYLDNKDKYLEASKYIKTLSKKEKKY